MPALLPANATHRAGRRHKIGFANMMPGFLAQDNRAQPIGQFLIAGAATQQRAQVMLLHAEKTRPDLPVSGQPNPVAMPAKRLADRGDNANLAAAIFETPPF